MYPQKCPQLYGGDVPEGGRKERQDSVAAGKNSWVGGKIGFSRWAWSAFATRLLSPMNFRTALGGREYPFPKAIAWRCLFRSLCRRGVRLGRLWLMLWAYFGGYRMGGIEQEFLRE